jgi:molybdopterin molybdotransferase
MLTPSEALELILARAPSLGPEEHAVGAGLVGRVLAAPVVSPIDVPPFAISAMDGYAVRAADLGNGPVPVAFRVAAGDAPSELARGTAAGIATGAPMPDGADSVVPIEDAEEREGSLVADPPAPGAAVRAAGGDVGAGDTVGSAGDRLTPGRLAAIAAVGVATVQVAARPRIAVLATGDELTPPGQPLRPGMIYESNTTTVGSLALRAGGEVVHSELVPDDLEATRRAVKEALAEADVLVSSGGVSVGPHDHVKPALLSQGVEEVFWRIAHRPGKPLWFGVSQGGKLVFGIPGNPVSALVCFELFVRPALDRMQGAPPARRPVARLAREVPRLKTRDHAVRCRLVPGADGMQLVPDGPQDSHLIVHAAAADAVALVAHGDGVASAGELVEYVPLG